MFTHLVLLKKSPWFIYCKDEKDALTYASSLTEHLVGIAISQGGFEVKQPRMELRLTQEVTQQIELDPTKNENFLDPTAKEELDAELEKELDSSLEQ